MRLAGFIGLLSLCVSVYARAQSLNLLLDLERAEDLLDATRFQNDWRLYVWPYDPGDQSIDYRSQDSKFRYDYSQHGRTFAEMKTMLDASGTWTFTIQSGAGTSTYQASPRLTPIDPNQLVEASALYPAPAQAIMEHRPTFQWTQTGQTPADGVFQVISSKSIRNIEGIIGPGVTPPFDLDNDNYQLVISYVSEAQLIPIDSSWISGPNLGPMSVSLQYSYALQSPFSVVPEPFIGPLGICSIALCWRCRWKRSIPPLPGVPRANRRGIPPVHAVPEKK